MKDFILFLLAILPSIGCVAGAVLHFGNKGWGWFLVGALLLGVSASFETKGSNDGQ